MTLLRRNTLPLRSGYSISHASSAATQAAQRSTLPSGPSLHILSVMGDEKALHRRDIEFDAGGWNDPCAAGFIAPDSSRDPLPIIVMAGGFACVKEMHLDKYAAVFARAGLAVLVFDFRNLGASDGVPRQELNPWQQIEDYRHAITYAMTLSFVDADRIGVWGTSYSGGHVLAIAATDRRVKCVVAQVPTISGHWSGLRRVPMNRVDELNRVFAADRV